jgi:hypothetical protein
MQVVCSCADYGIMASQPLPMMQTVETVTTGGADEIYMWLVALMKQLKTPIDESHY